MTSAEVIEEIKRLPDGEQAKVFAFAREASKSAPLTPNELGDLARKLAEAGDPAEAGRLEQEIVRGFYGEQPHA